MARLHRIATSNPLFSDEQMADFKKKLAEAESAYNAAVANLEAAQAKMRAAQGNPFFTPAQVADLEVQLKKAEGAVAQTQAQIVATQEKLNKQSEADDKSHYGRALLQAMAFGRELLAEQLRENHAQLLAEQAQLADAKARGQSTAAIEKQIQAMKQREQLLIKEATENKQALITEEQITKAKILATQAILAEARARGLDATAIEKELRDLQALDKELQKGITSTKSLSRVQVELRDTTTSAMSDFVHAWESAMEGVFKGQESFGKAMEKLVLQLIGKLAQHWADYFLAKAIADVFDDPAEGAAEFAAATALETVAALMGALGDGGSGGASPAQAGVNQNVGASQSPGGQGGGTTVRNVQSFAAGGVISQPTIIKAGDSMTGGAAEEAILPLTDPTAMRKVAEAIIRSMIGNAQPEFQQAEASVPAVHGFSFGESEQMATRDFAAASGSSSSTPAFSAAPGSTSADRAFASPAAASGSERPSFVMAPYTFGVAPSFTRAEPSTTTSASEPSHTAFSPAEVAGKRDFLAAQGSPESPRPPIAAGTASPSVDRGFTAADASETQRSDMMFAPGTVGSLLGFNFAQPQARPSYEGLGFTNAPSSTEDVARSFEGATLPTVQRDDLAEVMERFGGLLSAGTLYSASRASTASAMSAAVSSGADMREMFGAVREALEGQAAGGDTHVVHNEGDMVLNVNGGMISDTDTKKLAKKLNTLVKKRRVVMTATHAYRIQRRSQ